MSQPTTPQTAAPTIAIEPIHSEPDDPKGWEVLIWLTGAVTENGADESGWYSKGIYPTRASAEAAAAKLRAAAEGGK